MPGSEQPAILVIGDIHGQLEKFTGLLRNAGLIGANNAWTGGKNALWLMGDLVDHGPDGIAVVDLVMGLQEQAAKAGGHVDVLLGNHDLLLMAAYRFGDEFFPGSDETFREIWEESGGVARDRERMTPDHARWFNALPAMAHASGHLLVHADAPLYTRYGSSIDEVNQFVAELLQSDDSAGWGRLLEGFEEHRAFTDPICGTAQAEAFLDRFGGAQIVHGHTPITKLTGQPPEAVREPLIYATDRCVDVDPGMYLGGPGFVYALSEGYGNW
ncbi:MAG: metallophosphoesterase [Thermomicrobiales bacterium]